MSIKKRAFQGIRWKTGTTVLTAFLSILQLYILVRFIEKRDFGLMAIVNTVILFAQTFLDLGVSNGIIYKEKITSIQLSSLYWLSVTIGFILAFFVFISSVGIAGFYQEEEMIFLLKIMSITFVINGFGNQFKILLTKELRFELLSKIELSSTLLAFIVTVVLAVKGFGILALVLGFLMKTGINSFLFFLFGRSIHMPALAFDFKEISFFINFGSFQMGESILNYFSKQIDVLVIGKVLGPDILGVYDVIKKFLLRPMSYINPVLTSVLFPVMAKIQKDTKGLSQAYLKQLNYLCLFNFPIYLFLFFYSESIITLMFGLDWLAYDLLFKLFSIFYLIYSIGNPIGTLILAKGRADLAFYWNVLVFVFFTTTSLIFVHWGIDNLAKILVLLQVLFILPLYFLVIKKLVPISLSSYLKTLLMPFCLALFINLISFYLVDRLTDTLWLILFLGMLINATLYLVLNARFNVGFVEDIKKLFLMK